MERSYHDLSNLLFSAGKMGRLMTLDHIPVLPGDGFSSDIVGALRLSPLKRNIIVDCVVDIVSFYIPHRHIYGDNWVDFIEQGNDETVTLATETLKAIADPASSIGLGSAETGTVPKYIPEGYRQIWNRYFRPPTTVAEKTGLHSTWTDDECVWGFRCANLKDFKSALLANNISASDYEVDVTSNKVSLLDIKEQEGHLKTEQEREYFNLRYADIVNSFGGFTNYSADDRPQMLMRSTFWASGYDVDGTDLDSLGQYTGRVSQAFRHRVPRFHVPEHGMIWHVALVRYPNLHHEEQHYLTNHPQPTYAEISGDPAIVATKPPIALTPEDIYNESSDTTVLGYVPYGQWYRTHPSNIHDHYLNVNGFPFLDTIKTTTEAHVLVEPDEYDKVFSTLQLGHWNIQARANNHCMRRLPSAAQSLMTGR